MGSEVVRALAELQRRVAVLERPRTAAPTVPVLSSVTKTISDVRIADATANQALHDANNITSTQITEGAIETPHLTANALDGMVITGATIRTAAVNPRMEMTTAGLRGYGTAGHRWVDLTPNGLRTFYDGTTQTAQYLWTGSTAADSGLWTYRQDGTVSSMITSDGIRTRYEDGTTTAQVLWTGNGASDSGLWTYRSDGTVSSIINNGGIYTRYPNGQNAIRVYAVAGETGISIRDEAGTLRNIFNGDGFTTYDAAGVLSLQVGANYPYPQERIYSANALGLIGGGMQGLTVTTPGVAFDNYIFANYFRTTTAAANLHRSSTDAQIYLVTSNGYNKLNQADIDLAEAEALLDVAPKTWVDRRDADNPDAQRIPGFVAEDVAAASQAHGGALDPLLTTGSDTLGTAYMGVNYDRVAAYLIPLIRDLRERVATLETA